MTTRRRVLLRATAGAGAVLGLPVLGAAPETPARKGPPHRIGILGIGRSAEQTGSQPNHPSGAAFMRGMAEAGWRYSTQFTTVTRGNEGRAALIDPMTLEMLREAPDVIVCAGFYALPLKRVGVSVPVVICGSPDPVGQGLVQSLAAPGTMFTGLSNLIVELVPKRLELLAELCPPPARLALLRQLGHEATSVTHPLALVQAAARRLGREIELLDVAEHDELPQKLRDARRRGITGMLVAGFLGQRHLVDEMATQAGIALMWAFRATTPTQEVISHSVDFAAVWHRAAHYVDRILRGAHPGTLPIEQPTKIDLVIDLRTAARLGIRVPASLLIRAARVVE